eukprot:CAMPEP_0119421538 /NCGR_PEP_ID=MMETSP1335-20130426/26133_1 /TAXON_ID=259385 /ORGANISM="Chrysoculter rhomboideus, Strain RCC1486" /LENGTH=84 /DNA_ID=CAMNT_0007446947 /DNA_START=144 /DNA_END=398 /DNA_ORIENTATION=-
MPSSPALRKSRASLGFIACLAIVSVKIAISCASCSASCWLRATAFARMASHSRRSVKSRAAKETMCAGISTADVRNASEQRSPA